MRKNLHTIQQNERSAAQRSDVLNFQIQRIRKQPVNNANEVPELLAERNRLANAEKLAQLAEAVLQVGADGLGEELSSVADLLAKMVQSLDKLARLDPSQSELAEQRRAYRSPAKTCWQPCKITASEFSFTLSVCCKWKNDCACWSNPSANMADNMADI